MNYIKDSQSIENVPVYSTIMKVSKASKASKASSSGLQKVELFSSRICLSQKARKKRDKPVKVQQKSSDASQERQERRVGAPVTTVRSRISKFFANLPCVGRCYTGSTDTDNTKPTELIMASSDELSTTSSDELRELIMASSEEVSSTSFSEVSELSFGESTTASFGESIPASFGESIPASLFGESIPASSEKNLSKHGSKTGKGIARMCTSGMRKVHSMSLQDLSSTLKDVKKTMSQKFISMRQLTTNSGYVIDEQAIYAPEVVLSWHNLNNVSNEAKDSFYDELMVMRATAEGKMTSCKQKEFDIVQDLHDQMKALNQQGDEAIVQNGMSDIFENIAKKKSEYQQGEQKEMLIMQEKVETLMDEKLKSNSDMPEGDRDLLYFMRHYKKQIGACTLNMSAQNPSEIYENFITCINDMLAGYDINVPQEQEQSDLRMSSKDVEAMSPHATTLQPISVYTWQDAIQATRALLKCRQDSEELLADIFALYAEVQSGGNITFDKQQVGRYMSYLEQYIKIFQVFSEGASKFMVNFSNIGYQAENIKQEAYEKVNVQLLAAVEQVGVFLKKYDKSFVCEKYMNDITLLGTMATVLEIYDSKLKMTDYLDQMQGEFLVDYDDNYDDNIPL